MRTMTFHNEADLLMEWMNDTEKLIESLHVDMDPREASRVQESIEVRFTEKKNSYVACLKLLSLVYTYETSINININISASISISSCEPERRKHK